MSDLPLEGVLGTSWATVLNDEIKKEYFRRIPNILKRERENYTIYPSSENVFKAYRLCPYDKVRFVIIGQDPYHGENQANGLAFSVNDSLEQFPPSLKNIFKEIEDDLQIFHPHWSGDLTSWAEQGGFLLNTYLTVRAGNPLSHENIGWERFTKETIKLINLSPVPVVFMLWGSHARSYKQYIDESHHCILEASHPSPLSAYRSFFGCKHFSTCNTFLENNKLKPINWITTI